MGDDRIPPSVAEQIASPEFEPLSSMTSLWEISIKVGLGKLTYPLIDQPDLPEILAAKGFKNLLITFAEVRMMKDLPNHHRDPFDRLLVAQATIEKFPLISRDEKIEMYNVELWWG